MKAMVLSRDYRLTIPKDVRERYGIKVGDVMRISIDAGNIVLTPKNPVEWRKHTLTRSRHRQGAE